MPAGDLTAISNTSRLGYTGHEHLDNLGLIHMNGRVQDPFIGRFLSADPFVPDPLNGQSFNRFSYVRNNPLALIDPSGFTEEPSEQCVFCVYQSTSSIFAPGMFGSLYGTGALSFVGSQYMNAESGTAPTGFAAHDAGNELPSGAMGWVGVHAAVSCPAIIGPGINPGDTSACGGFGHGVENAAAIFVPGWGAGRRADRAWAEGRYGHWGGWIIAGTGEMLLFAVTLGESGAILAGERAAVSSAARVMAPSSRALGTALEGAGIARPAESAAHHIVAGGAAAAAQARAVLQRFGIGINDAANGVFLPATRASANPLGADGAFYGSHKRLLSNC